MNMPQSNSKMKNIVILGAGISGLATAWYLKKKYGASVNLTLLEKSGRPGGWIQTIKSNDFLFELGPRSCRPKGNGRETLQLIQELGLESEVICGDSKAHRRFLFYNQKLQPLPSGVFSLLCSPLMKGLGKAIWQDLHAAKGIADDESIYDFAARRLGNDWAERLFDPMTSGIYAGDIKKLSLKSCFPPLANWEKSHGSIIKALFFGKRSKQKAPSPFCERIEREPLFSFKNGMETLTQTLAARLDKHIIYNCQISKLIPQDNGILIEMDNQTTLHADSLYSCLPAYALSQLCSKTAPILSEKLQVIPSASVATINVGYRKFLLKQPGFGHLIPHSENEDVLGIVWDSSVFPEQNQSKAETRLTVMMGGSRREDILQLDEGVIKEKALNAIAKQLGIETHPDSLVIHKAHNAIPQYTVGHQTRIEEIHRLATEFSPSLTLLGNSFHGVSVNDCIANVRQIIEASTSAS